VGIRTSLRNANAATCRGSQALIIKRKSFKSEFALVTFRPAEWRIAAVDGDARNFALMTFTPFQPLLEDVSAPLAAYAAYANDQPCGFLLARTGVEIGGRDENTVRLLSVFVHPARRRQGIAGALMDTLRAGFPGKKLWALWSAELPRAAEFEALLASRGWSEKAVEVYHVMSTPRRVLGHAQSRPGWRTVDHFGPYTWTQWAERSPADEEAARALIAQPDFPTYCNPFEFERTRNVWMENSMILRQRGAPVGWLFTHRIGDDVIYDCHYVRPDLSRLGVMLLMMAAMYRRQGELLGPDSSATYLMRPTAKSSPIVHKNLGAQDIVTHYVASREG
jgi:GNAT superfamily N-acetyltransferase